MVAAALAYILTPAGRLVAIGLAAAALASGVWFIYSKIEQTGYDRAISEIASDNQEALDRVKIGKNKLRSCIDRGKSWDQSNGVCIE